MLNLKARRTQTLGFFFALGLPIAAHGWGQQGHMIVARVGAELAPQGSDFWSANAAQMAKLSVVPDNFWKKGKSREGERPTHWFQIDSYFKSSADYSKFPRAYGVALDRYGEEKVLVNGTAPWRIHQFETAAVAAIQHNDFKEALEFAGVMSHYVGDLSQPLHVTENYDGQMTDNKGIHAYFETDVIEDHVKGLEASVAKEAQALLRDPNFVKEFKGTLLQAVFRSINRSIAFKDQILAIDTKYGRTDEAGARQLKIVRSRLADGAATLAMILGRIWQEGGKPDSGATVKTDVPAWVPPVFDEAATREKSLMSMNLRGVSEMIETYEAHDDCE